MANIVFKSFILCVALIAFELFPLKAFSEDLQECITLLQEIHGTIPGPRFAEVFSSLNSTDRKQLTKALQTKQYYGKQTNIVGIFGQFFKDRTIGQFSPSVQQHLRKLIEEAGLSSVAAEIRKSREWMDEYKENPITATILESAKTRQSAIMPDSPILDVQREFSASASASIIDRIQKIYFVGREMDRFILLRSPMISAFVPFPHDEIRLYKTLTSSAQADWDFVNLLPTKEFNAELSKMKEQKIYLSQVEDPEVRKNVELLFDSMIERLMSARSLEKTDYVKQRLKRNSFGIRVGVIFGIRVFLIGSAIFILS